MAEKWFQRHPKFAIVSGIALLAGIAAVAFGFFGVHLLFVDNEVTEGPPVFASTGTVGPPESSLATTTTPSPTQTIATVPISVAGTDNPTPVSTVPVITVPEQPASTTVPATVAPATVSTVPPVPQIVTEFSGTFVSLDHPTAGSAIVQGNGTGQRFLRFEQFETDNGPDLNVYLVNSSAGGVNDFVDLGSLKGNIGDQNYEIPPGVDLTVYDTVLIWCVRFSSGFGEAALS